MSILVVIIEKYIFTTCMSLKYLKRCKRPNFSSHIVTYSNFKQLSFLYDSVRLVVLFLVGLPAY